MKKTTLTKIYDNLKFLSTHNKNYNKTQYYTILDTLEIVENEIRYNRIIELLEINEIAFQHDGEENWINIANESHENIFQKLPFKNQAEKDDFLTMSETFMDYDIYKETVLRIANRLLIVKE